MARRLRSTLIQAPVAFDVVRCPGLNKEEIIMFKKLFAVGVSALILSFGTTFSFGQDTVITKKEVVVNADGSYTVIEYPVGREVAVSLLPSAGVAGAKGTARVVRSADGTRIVFDVAGMPLTAKSYYAYTVDPSGVPTMLGPLTVENGIAKGEFTTTMSQFMLVLSPLENVTAITPTNVMFTSEVPTGYTIVPRRVVGGPRQVVAVAGTSKMAYDVAMLNVPTWTNVARKANLEFGSDYSGLKAEAEIRPEKGVTKISLNMENMKRAPAGTRIVLWAVNNEGKYSKLGQVVNSGQRDDTTIKTETALTDFGLFMTVEAADVDLPSGRVYSVFRVIP